MLASISPLGERARASRWWLTVAAYVVSSTLAGALLGAVAGLLGGFVPDRWRWSPVGLLVAAALLLVGLALDLDATAVRLPSWRRQVAQSWIGQYRGWVVGAGFGAQLGLGVVTIVTSSTTYAVVLLAALTGDLGSGALVGAVFGLVRALPLLLTARVRTRDDLWRVLRGVERNAPRADVVARLALVAGAATLAWVAAT